MSSEYTEILKKVFTSGNMKDGFFPLYIETDNVCLVLLRKGNFNGVFYNTNPSIFNDLKCHKCFSYYAIPKEMVLNMNTACLAIYNCDEAGNQAQDENNAQENFKKDGKYVANGKAIIILENKFKPSAGIRNGFDYRYGTIVVRGHEKHVAAELRALDDYKKDMKVIMDKYNAENMQLIDLKLCQDLRIELESALNSSTRLENVNQSNMKQDISKNLQRFFEIVQNINSLRGQVTVSGMEQSKRKLEAIKINIFKIIDTELKLITEGDVKTLKNRCTNMQEKVTIMQKEVTNLGDKVANFQQSLKDITIDDKKSENQDRRAKLLTVLKQELEEFYKIVKDDEVTSAHLPIFRIYQEISIGQQQILHGCWHLIGQIIDIQDQTQSISFFPNKEYRENFLTILRNEYDFFKGDDLNEYRLPHKLTKYKKDIDELEKLNISWKKIEAVSEEEDLLSLHKVIEQLNKMNESFIYLFEKVLQVKLQGLNMELRNPQEPKNIELISDHLPGVILLLFSRIDLIDEKLKLANKLTKDDKAINYTDSSYAKERKVLDSQLFLIINHYLLTIPTSHDYDHPSALMEKMAKFLCSYLTSTRCYGFLPSKFTTTSKEIARFLNGPIQIIDDIAGRLWKAKLDDLNIFNNLSNQLSEYQENFYQYGQNILEHLKIYNEGGDWWKEFKVYANELKNQETSMNETLSNIEDKLKGLNINEDALSNLSEKKGYLIASLKRIRELESKRSILRNECNALIQIAEESAEAGRVNRQLIEAGNSLEIIESKLMNLKEGTSFDLLIRDKFVEQLGFASAVLIADPNKELFLRIDGIRDKLTRNFQEPNDWEKQLKEKVKPFNLLAIEESEEKFLNKLHGKINEVPDEAKVVWKQVEFRHAVSIIDQIIKDLTKKYCSDLGSQFTAQTAGLNLSVIKREWVNHRNKTLTTYCWMKNGLKDDPFHKSKETHIAI